MVKERLISHSSSDGSLDAAIKDLKQRIEAVGDKAHVSVTEQLNLLDDLARFELGRFLIKNRGMNGFWTNYVTTYPRSKASPEASLNRDMSQLERFIVEERPLAKATQQRFEIFLQLAQNEVREGAVLASVPCGLMADLLLLDFTAVQTITLVGIDLDPESILQAKNLAASTGLSKWTRFYERDAWRLGLTNEFSLVVSSGLNIYESDESRLLALYRALYDALKPDGVLVTSFFTPPPWAGNSSEWDLAQIEQRALRLQSIVYDDILGFKAQSYVTSEQIQQQLKSVGFGRVEVIYDRARIFPVVRAQK